jgi:hypothetical protein
MGFWPEQDQSKTGRSWLRCGKIPTTSPQNEATAFLVGVLVAQEHIECAGKAKQTSRDDPKDR